MVSTLPTESWTLPVSSQTFNSTLPNYEEFTALRVNHDGVKNYVKNRGTLNIGEWAIEGRRMSATGRVPQPVIGDRTALVAPPPKVLGPDAMRNYLKSTSSTPNLIYGDLAAPSAHHGLRVKREGQQNYHKNQHSQTKVLFENYGKLPIPEQPAPHTQGETATNIYYEHQGGQMGSILGNYGRAPPSPRPAPHVKGSAAASNLQKGQGVAQLLHHTNDTRPPTPEPHVKGVQAHANYEMGQGRIVDKLFYDYGKLPQSARLAPKVKYDGVENFRKGQGDAMRKTLSQCPQSSRFLERPQSAPLWP